ncbi:hypothetical protein [Ilumatobacter sp.]|uniref:hypothetical protein n=1 Tax=Ilumatobacter sp. TaxID=1967498 RepID=UPI003751F9DE
MANTITLTTDHRALVASVINSDVKVGEWQAKASDAWQAIMVVALGDEKLAEALRSLYVKRRINAATPGSMVLTVEESAAVTLSAKNVWKQRKAEVKRKLASGNELVTGRESRPKGKKERLADVTAAARRALAAGCTTEDILAALSA